MADEPYINIRTQKKVVRPNINAGGKAPAIKGDRAVGRRVIKTTDHGVDDKIDLA